MPKEESVLGKMKLPGEAYSLRIRARFWIMGHKNRAYVGIGRIELLEYVDSLGSINKAAKQMGMSYKKAWKLIDDLNGMCIEPLVVKEHGGKLGGGTQLTKKGRELINKFRVLEIKLTDFLEGQSTNL